MDEKRGFVRFRVSFPFKFVREKLSSEVEGRVKDISMNGLKVVLDKALHFLVEDLANFHLVLPDDRILKISGEVMWQKDYLNRREIGIRFAHITNDHKEDIYDYISKYHRQELTQKWWQM